MNFGLIHIPADGFFSQGIYSTLDFTVFRKYRIRYKCLYYSSPNRVIYEYFPGVPQSFSVYTFKGHGIAHGLLFSIKSGTASINYALLLNKTEKTPLPEYITIQQLQMAIDL